MLKTRIKAIGLLSGGLDSTLAVRIMHDQGIEIQVVHFSTGFCQTDSTARIRRPEEVDSMQGGPADAFTVAEELGIPIKLINISDGYLDVIHNPKYGYGKNVNPCVDCRIFMFSTAKWLMEELEAKFLFTGEVLGQRPKSQKMRQMNLIAKQSGLDDILLRPLSARLLPPTLPEREGWVDREMLYGFHGRTRKPQMALAGEFGIAKYPQPAGGCCTLTDPGYAKKVNDMWEFGTKAEMEWDDYLLLRIGRHLRVDSELKVVVGRNEAENSYLENYCKGRVRLEAENTVGPVVLIDGSANSDQQRTAARITARYADTPEGGEDVIVRIENGRGTHRMTVAPFSPEEVSAWVIR